MDSLYNRSMSKEIYKQNGFTFQLNRSARAKRFRISIGTEREFRVTVPKRALDFQIKHFLAQNKSWISRQIKRMEKENQNHPRPKYESGDRFYYFGESLSLSVKPQDLKRVRVKVRVRELEVLINRLVTKEEGKRQIRQGIERFYRKKAEEVIRDRLEFFNEQYGFQFNRVSFRNQKTRWGSCSAKRNLNFNWRLIMAPIEVIDYVVVHELCHLQQMNHSAKFWQLVEKAIPDFKERRKWLKKNHYLLAF